MPHPALWPSLIGAVVGAVVLLLAGWLLVRRWHGWRPARRWTVGLAVGLFAAAYGLNVYAWLIEPNLLWCGG